MTRRHSNLRILHWRSHRPRAAALLVGVALASLAIGIGLTAVASAELDLKPGSFKVTSNTDQAGAYPDLTTSFKFQTHNNSTEGNVKDVTVDLPPGFAGDPLATPTCTSQELQQSGYHTACPPGSQVGIIELSVRAEEQPIEVVEPLFNMTAAPGTAATLGFNFSSILVQEFFVTVRPGDAGLQVSVPNIDGTLQVSRSSVTVWGIPGSASHNAMRNARCFFGVCSGGGEVATTEALPFLSNPTNCAGAPMTATITADSWQQPEQRIEANTPVGPMTGCEKLGFSPSISLQPTTLSAYSPMGLNVGVSVPQNWYTPVGLASANLDNAVVTLPEGITVNPSAGSGLGACTPEQYAAETLETPPGAGCPENSKIGTVNIETPVLKEDATGAVYVATPHDNPFNSLLALYLVAKIPNRGVIVKTAGKVELNPASGQLTTTFDENPQLPFSHFTLSFHQGATSPLVSPPTCGVFAGKASLSGWSEPEVFDTVSDSFVIPDGIGGSPCPAGGTPPFDPGLVAGTLNNSAGVYSPLDIRITRNDGEQEITRFSSELPSGLTAKLTDVPFCSDADIEAARNVSGAQEEAEPSCPAASEIGHSLVGAGVGSVLAWAPGKVYMAGPYNGAPFSIVAVTSAKVGPFDLGTVVVREALEINPETAAVTVDAKASDAIPHIIDGIVVHVRDIRVYIDRPEFMINPTNCNPMDLVATVDGAGADPANPADQRPVAVSDSFQVANCQNLAFKPTFKATTSGKTSRVGGAGLTVKLTYPKAPQGTQANIKLVKVELPKRLPSRLSTLQKACLDTIFAENPASCPAASVIGHAIATTPILPVPLTGPAYFVSHGGAKFPELVIVLQGYGVTLDLHGETFISKKGITSSTFKAVPDDPIGGFELVLPRGPYSALAANGNLCKSKLAMPTKFVAQSGRTINQMTPITVTGCRRRGIKKIKAHGSKEHGGSRRHTRAPVKQK